MPIANLLLPKPTNVPPLRPACPACGNIMRLVSVSPSMKGVIYGYLCKDEHAFEFTITDQGH
jgi:hypothetical protein